MDVQETVCIVRKWAEKYPAMQTTFSFDGIKQACGDAVVPTSRYSKNVMDPFKLQEDTEVRLANFIDGLSSPDTSKKHVVFDESIPTMCLSILQNYTVPFMAVNDYIHRAITGHCNWFDGRNCEEYLEDHLGWVPFTDHPSLFVQPNQTQCGHHVDAFHSHFLQVLHVGRKEWRLGGSTPAEAQTIVAEESDLIFIPAGIRHSVFNLDACIATSINIIDSSNWEQAIAQDHLGAVNAKLLQQLESYHHSAKPVVQTSQPWATWIMGVAGELIPISKKEDL